VVPGGKPFQSPHAWNLQQKFNYLLATKGGTGQTTVPTEVARAQSIKETIIRAAKTVVMGPQIIETQ
jgi:hypothetical protein